MMNKQEIRQSAALPLRGGVIYLREIELSDVSTRYLSWMNDKDVNQYLESRFAVHTLESLGNFVRKRRESEFEWMFAICASESDLHIGNIKLGPVNTHHGVGEIGLLLGEKSWHRGGVGTQAIGLVVDFAFNVLGLRRLTTGMYSENLGSFRAFQKCGFSLEGTLKEHYKFDDTYLDGFRMGLLRENRNDANE